MIVFAETERLILRELVLTDDEAFFIMDSDPEVHLYLGNKPVKHIDEVRQSIRSVQQQFKSYGIGRWAVIEKSSGAFVGWSGLKFITEPKNERTNYHDVGYRLDKKFWGKGYATESAKAAIEYGFNKMNLEEIIGTAHQENVKSRRALEKCGLQFIEKFNFNGLPCDWLKITKEDWQLNNISPKK